MLCPFLWADAVGVGGYLTQEPIFDWPPNGGGYPAPSNGLKVIALGHRKSAGWVNTGGGSGMTLIRDSSEGGNPCLPSSPLPQPASLGPGKLSDIAGMSAPDIRRYTASQGRVFTSTQSFKETSPRCLGSHSSNLPPGLPPRRQDAAVNELERLFKLPILHSQDD